MRNHNQKHRDMARSVLPSTGCVGARQDRRAIHHRERTRLREALAGVRQTADADDVDADLTYVDRGAIASMVADRRGGDKVGPLMRWAERTVAQSPRLRAMSPRDQLEHFRRLMPSNLIGEHALSHIGWALGVDRRWYGTYRYPQPPTIAELTDAVDRVLAAGALGELNRALKAMRFTTTDASGVVVTLGPTLLRGAHDTDRFVAELRADVRAKVIELAASM